LIICADVRSRADPGWAASPPARLPVSIAPCGKQFGRSAYMDSFDYNCEVRPRGEIGLSLLEGIYGLKSCYLNQADRPGPPELKEFALWGQEWEIGSETRAS